MKGPADANRREAYRSQKILAMFLLVELIVLFFGWKTLWGLEEGDGFQDQLGIEVVATKRPDKPAVELRTPTMEMYPCLDCHEEQITNPNPRELKEEHESIVWDHNATLKWCLDCHSDEQMDSLRLIDGTRISFTESHRLCGQCHGPKHRDWELGIHGLRTGGWDRPKVMRNCPVCHDPHKPAFKPMKPSPPPERPQPFAGVGGGGEKTKSHREGPTSHDE